MARKQQQSDQVEQLQDNETPEQQLTPKQTVQREISRMLDQRRILLEKLTQQRDSQIEKYEKLKEEKLADINPKINTIEKEILYFENIIDPVNVFIENLEIPEA